MKSSKKSSKKPAGKKTAATKAATKTPATAKKKAAAETRHAVASVADSLARYSTPAQQAWVCETFFNAFLLVDNYSFDQHLENCPVDADGNLAVELLPPEILAERGISDPATRVAIYTRLLDSMAAGDDFDLDAIIADCAGTPLEPTAEDAPLSLVFNTEVLVTVKGKSVRGRIETINDAAGVYMVRLGIDKGSKLIAATPDQVTIAVDDEPDDEPDYEPDDDAPDDLIEDDEPPAPAKPTKPAAATAKADSKHPVAAHTLIIPKAAHDEAVTLLKSGRSRKGTGEAVSLAGGKLAIDGKYSFEANIRNGASKPFCDIHVYDMPDDRELMTLEPADPAKGLLGTYEFTGRRQKYRVTIQAR